MIAAANDALGWPSAIVGCVAVIALAAMAIFSDRPPRR